MARHIYRLLASPDYINNCNNALRGIGEHPDPPDHDEHIYELSHEFSHGMEFVVGITRERQLVSKLYDHAGGLLATCHAEDHALQDTVEQVFTIDYGQAHDRYILTIARAAATTLQAANVAAYNAAPMHCPFCRSTDIHAHPAEGPTELRTLIMPVSCCVCSATWQDVFTFAGIVADDTTAWTAPTLNVPQVTEEPPTA